MKTENVEEAIRLAVQALQLLGRAAESLAGAINSEREQKPKEGLAVAPAKKSPGRKSVCTPERVELLKTMSVGEAARRFGVSKGCIYYLRHKYGIARRYAKGKVANQASPAKAMPAKEYDSAIYEEKQRAREDALRASAEHGARATEGKVSVRVDPHTTVLMSPEKAEAFIKSRNAIAGMGRNVIGKISV